MLLIPSSRGIAVKDLATNKGRGFGLLPIPRFSVDHAILHRLLGHVMPSSPDCIIAFVTSFSNLASTWPLTKSVMEDTLQ
jgi:hypothetical protein